MYVYFWILLSSPMFFISLCIFDCVFFWVLFHRFFFFAFSKETKTKKNHQTNKHIVTSTEKSVVVLWRKCLTFFFWWYLNFSVNLFKVFFFLSYCIFIIVCKEYELCIIEFIFDLGSMIRFESIKYVFWNFET